MASITPKEDFDAEELAKDLRKAMKGFGTNEKEIIEVLTSIDNAQRQEVKLAFKTTLGRDLEDDLKSELGGNFEDAVLALLRTPAEYDAWTLREAMSGAGTDESDISEVLASRTNEQIEAIKEVYAKEYKRDLEEDLKSENGGNLKRIYVSLVQGNRKEDDETDDEKAEADAQALLEAGEKAWGTDESEFNRVLMVNNAAQLRLIGEKYRGISDYDVRRVIEKEMSGNLEFAMVALWLCATKPAEFFADRAYRAMKGMGTADKDLQRVIISRSEIDLEEIKAVFQDKYGKKLSKMIADDIGGDYKRLMLAIVGE
eukprot:TRINITY_DN12031_c0_g1_i7.p1 TRINITY_DN12031_c0_g1~~TRINITY_DN12031_c0_g1_i7.p1  ORF type:complete len:314 (+),score=113.41 TRINITY_DN12031_c0_g1_i7:86-1027(+)